MYDLIPLAAGVMCGLAAARIHGARAATALIVALALVAGIAASTLSGEIHESFAFVLWDTAQAAMAAVLALVGARRLLRTMAPS